MALGIMTLLKIMCGIVAISIIVLRIAAIIMMHSKRTLSIRALGIMILCVMAFTTTPIRMMALCIMIRSIMTHRITTLTMKLFKMALSITILSIMALITSVLSIVKEKICSVVI